MCCLECSPSFIKDTFSLTGVAQIKKLSILEVRVCLFYEKQLGVDLSIGKAGNWPMKGPNKSNL